MGSHRNARRVRLSVFIARMAPLLRVAALACAAHAFVPLQRLARPVQTSRPWALWASDGDDEAPKIVAEEAEDAGPEPGEEGYEPPKIAVPAPKPAPPKPAPPKPAPKGGG